MKKGVKSWTRPPQKIPENHQNIDLLQDFQKDPHKRSLKSPEIYMFDTNLGQDPTKYD